VKREKKSRSPPPAGPPQFGSVLEPVLREIQFGNSSRHPFGLVSVEMQHW
jgi:hypothetical protein